VFPSTLTSQRGLHDLQRHEMKVMDEEDAPEPTMASHELPRRSQTPTRTTHLYRQTRRSGETAWLSCLARRSAEPAGFGSPATRMSIGRDETEAKEGHGVSHVEWHCG
jgi:hypothetical protein